MPSKGTNLFQGADKIIKGTASAGAYIGGFLLFLMMLLISADAIGRYVFNDSIKGVLDLIEILLVFIVFFSVGQVAILKSHVSVTLLFSRFPKGYQALFNIITSLSCLVISFLMARQLALRGWAQMFHPTSYSQSLEIPLGPIYLMAALGLLTLSLVLLADFIRCLIDLNKLKRNP
ncbi:TRAP transporter small permease [Deltaproteobacteria bacterium]|nr:TRAP transporter small permease [Deltaproteobacteria bacterium]